MPGSVWEKRCHKGGAEAHHVLQVDEGVVDGCDFDALLQASPQDQATDAAKAAHGQGRRQKLHLFTANLPLICLNV